MPSSTTLSTGTSGSMTVSRIANSSSRDGSARFTTWRPGCERATICISGEHVAEVLGVASVAAAALHVARRPAR